MVLRDTLPVAAGSSPVPGHVLLNRAADFAEGLHCGPGVGAIADLQTAGHARAGVLNALAQAGADIGQGHQHLRR